MKCRVLLVEDHEDLARIMTSMIEACGYEVVGPAATIAEAVKLIEDGRLDVALVDQGLPDGPGTEVVRDLLDRGIPSAVLSGYYRDDELDRGLEDVPWLLKPVEQRDLEGALEALCSEVDDSEHSREADQLLDTGEE